MLEPRLGEKMGDRYRLLELIGRGGMGSVYQARDEVLWRDVAIKLFDASTELKDVQRQEDEINVLASLNHHGLVTLLDASMDRSDPERPRIYFVMELVQGIDLEKRLELGALSGREIAQVGFDVAEALQYIHYRGVVHRDLKPSNVLMVDYRNANRRARAKLTDFGIALVQQGTRVTGEGMTTGTAAYLSPEQVAKEPVGPASDIYSFGLVLLECFTRRLAFDGDPIQSAVARLNADPDIPAFIGDEWRALLRAMTAREPSDRPDSDEVVLLLRQAVIAETGRHRSVGSNPHGSERERLAAVHRYEILDAPPDAAFDRIAALAARVFDVPIGLVSIVDEKRVWFASHPGLDREQIDRESSLLASAAGAPGPWVIEDASTDIRVMNSPLVSGESGLRFCAGAPLTSPDGHHLGALCVLGSEPRAVTESELATLADLAALVMDELNRRVAGARIDNVTRLVPRLDHDDSDQAQA